MSKLKFGSLIAVVMLVAGCAHSLPQQDLQPEVAKDVGYLVSYDDAKSRGGMASYVPQICSEGGWGAPADDCNGKKMMEPVAEMETPAMAPVEEVAPGVMAAAKAAATPRLEVYFDSGRSIIGSSEKSRIRTWVNAHKMAGKELKKLSIRGFADSRGNADFNKKLSEKRAREVALELMTYEIEAQESLNAGLGALPGTESAEVAKTARRVEVSVE